MKLAKIRKDVAERIPATHMPKDFKLDRRGYFLIKTENKKIIVGYCTNSHILKKEIFGTSAEAIYNTMIREKLVGSLQHAAYLGHELARAEAALRSRKKYVQDKGMRF